MISDRPFARGNMLGFRRLILRLERVACLLGSCSGGDDGEIRIGVAGVLIPDGAANRFFTSGCKRPRYKGPSSQRPLLPNLP